MGKPFSDISRGAELKTAQDNYNLYKSDLSSRTTKRVTGGTGKAKDSLIVGVLPFSETVAALDANAGGVLVKMTKVVAGTTPAPPTWADTKADNYYDKTPTGTGKTFSKPRTGFRAARMTASSLVTPSATTVPYVKSKFTKLYYPKPPRTAKHYAIGRLLSAPATSDEVQTKNAIYVDLVTQLAAERGRTLTFKDEKMGGIR
jgi:hypothetical protein